MNLILASESPGRKKALEDAGFAFEVIPSKFEEDMTLPMALSELVIHLSQGKARNVAEQCKGRDGVIISADTVGVFEGRVLGKPHTQEVARQMLSMLSGKIHSMVTGLTVIDVKNQREITRSVETKIWFREIPMAEIIEYAKTEEGLKKAGGYAYQANGHKFVQKIEGSESNIIGLPLDELREMLKEITK